MTGRCAPRRPAGGRAPRLRRETPSGLPSAWMLSGYRMIASREHRGRAPIRDQPLRIRRARTGGFHVAGGFQGARRRRVDRCVDVRSSVIDPAPAPFAPAIPRRGSGHYVVDKARFRPGAGRVPGAVPPITIIAQHAGPPGDEPPGYVEKRPPGFLVRRCCPATGRSFRGKHHWHAGGNARAARIPRARMGGFHVAGGFQGDPRRRTNPRTSR